MNQSLIDEIVAKVVAMVQERMLTAVPSQHILMLFSGASTGYVVGMEAIRRLTRANHKLTVVMSPSAMHVVGEDHVRQAGATNLVLPGEWINTPGLVREVDLVLLPTLSMNTAAKLANGLMDSLMATLVLGALLDDKPVIAIRDGADPYGNGGLIFSDSYHGAPALRAKLGGHLNQLCDFGIKLVSEDSFLPALSHQIGAGATQLDTSPVSTLSKQTTVSLDSHLQTNIVTESDLLVFQPGTTLFLNPGARITPLAQDTAQKRKLTLAFKAL